MQYTAKHVVNDLDGAFPTTFKEILALKGVGPYTAAAIASICFEEPTPVIDGNVFRVISRLFAVEDDILKSGTRKVFWDILEDLIDQNVPGEFNQAIMEYGATVCAPVPKCQTCQVISYCEAFKQKRVKDFPVKKKKLKVTERSISYFVFTHLGKVVLKKRSGSDIWKGLYDFPETDTVVLQKERKYELHAPVTHLLSHRKLHVQFFQKEVDDTTFHRLIQQEDLEAFSIKQILTLPKPKVITDFINQIFPN